MSSIVTGLRTALDQVRSLGGQLGLRPYTVTVRVNTWSGSSKNLPGAGTSVTTSTTLTTSGSNAVRVERLSTRDVIASSGMYTDGDYLVGPITPYFSGSSGTGGFNLSALDPAVIGPNTTVQFHISGSEMGANGSLFQKVETRATSNLSYYVVVRKEKTSP